MSFLASELLQPPAARPLSQAMRSLGYSPETALADLVDNSIAAKARKVWVLLGRTPKAPNGRLTLLDDGSGMSAAELLNAMRPGTRDPLEARDRSDLGRFGLGLKTASFSQCRSLTVATRTTGSDEVVILRWDLDHVAKSNAWRLLPSAPEEVADDIALLRIVKSGTLVMWSKLDGFEADDTETLRGLREHLALTFHRFIEQGSLKIYTSMDPTLQVSMPVAAVDPFMRANPATGSSSVDSLNGICTVQTFVLPHPDRCTDEEREVAAMGRDWRDRQGCYIYRNERLLVAGGWLGLKRGWKNEADTQLARIKIDFLNTRDQDWKIDVLKSRASPPAAVRHRLMRLADLARKRSTDLFIHRARATRRTSQSKPEDLRHIPLWTSRPQTNGRTFSVNLDHPVIARVMRESGAASHALSLLSHALPMEQLWYEYKQRIEAEAEGSLRASASIDRDALRDDLVSFIRYETKKGGRALADVVREAQSIAPFCEHPDLIDTVLREFTA